jgi:hypothetical protein
MISKQKPPPVTGGRPKAVLRMASPIWQMNGETMTQLSLDLPKHNGNGRHRRRERDLAADLKAWLADLDAAEALRREQLRQIGKLRAQIYGHAKAHGVTPMILRAARKLRQR